MNDKMKSCLSGHTLMHSLFGFGLAIVLVNYVSALNNVMLGVILMVVAFVLDWMRKS